MQHTPTFGLRLTRSIATLTFSAALICPAASPLFAQAPATASASSNRVVGALLRIDGKTLALKDQQGKETSVTLTDATKLMRIAPGQTSLASATPIQLSDLAVGDRLLVRTQPAAADGSMTAVTVIAMKQADITQQQQQTQTAWQHGVGGLVKSVDAAKRSIVIDSRASGGLVTVQMAPTAVVKRYAPESIQYEQAQPSSIDKIMPGDQLRARGTAGSTTATDHSFKADEVVAGSFKNLSGKITGVDAQTGMVSFTDLASKQMVAIKVTDATQLRKLDDATADKLAASMKAANGGGRDGGGDRAAGDVKPAAGTPGGAAPAGSSPAGDSRGQREPSAAGSGSDAADMQQAFTRAAPIHLTDLRKNDLVMVVASAGADSQLGAVTVITGIEPLLRASPNGSAAMLSNWSMGGAPSSQ